MKKANPNQTKPADAGDDDTDDDDTRGSGSGSPYTRMTVPRSSTTTSQGKPHVHMEASWAWAWIPWARENEGRWERDDGREQTPNPISHPRIPFYDPRILRTPNALCHSSSTAPPHSPPPSPSLLPLLLPVPDHGSSPLKSLTVDPLTGIWQVCVCAADAIRVLYCRRASDDSS